MLFEIAPKIQVIDKVKTFTEEFNINEKDLVFTNRFLYATFFKDLNLNCGFIFQEDYNLREPSDDIIDKISEDIASKNYKRIIAAGGGSIIDISKVLSLKPCKNCAALFLKEVPAIKEKELFILPTTCGTGSEVTNISIAEIKSRNTKLGLATPEIFADYAILIPELVKNLPFEFFVYSSIDALIHAIESLVSPKANCYTKVFSKEAMTLIINGYKQIVKNGNDYRKEIIEDFVIGSNYAGIAFGNAGVGAVHALSYPLGGTYHVPHGEANYQFFIEVFKTYLKKNPNGKIKEVNELLKDLLEAPSTDVVYEELEKLLGNLISRKPLRQYGMKEEEINEFTDSVIINQQRLLANNYVSLSVDEIKEIYRSLY